MCGIAGLLDRNGGTANTAALDRMLERIRHRGPDDGGAWSDGPLAFGMRRLSIIDVAGGHQPVFNEDGSVGVVFNGEIYNFQELRDDLEKRGHRFATRSDTEVLVHLYEEEGVACVRRLRGMFAFSLWDRRRRRLFLARDRFGKKPLFYVEHAGRLAWASELQALQALPEWPRKIDLQAVDLYLSLQYIPSPRTIYESVKKLPPAHYMIVEKGVSTIMRYWDLPLDAPALDIGLEEAKEEIRRRLTEAVRLRLISEVPLGAFLSGGVDSSVIVGLMSRLSAQPVKTFSIGFDHEAFTELPHARAVAAHFGTDHREFTVTPDMADVLPTLARHYGEPFADASALPTYYVARETRRHVTVALNGDGGDENFAGYLRYQAEKIIGWIDRAPAPLVRGLRGAAALLPDGLGSKGLGWRLKRLLSGTLENDEAARHLRFARFFSEEEKAALYTSEVASTMTGGEALRWLREIFGRAAGLDAVNRGLYVDFSSYLPECLMTKVDIATMACSLEGRSPLLDHEFAEFVFRLPGAWKLRGVSGLKWIFKEAFRDLLPPSILRRKKMGFGIPLGPWFRQGPLHALFQDTVLSPTGLGRGVFRPEGLRALWAEHQAGHRDHGYRLWALLMWELWNRSVS